MLLLTSLLAPALKVGTSVRHAHRHRTSLVCSRIESGSTSKGMAKVALVELGSGCCHNTNSTKAAIRACNDAIEWNSVKVTTIIPGGYDALRLHVQIGVPSPETVDMDAVARCFPYGQLLPVAVEEGGLLGSSRAGVPSDEPPEAKMVRPNQRCTSTSTGASTSTPPSTHPHPHARQLRDSHTLPSVRRAAAAQTVAVACVTLGYGVPEATEADNRAAEAEWPAAAFEAAAPAAKADWAADWAVETSLGEMSAGEALLRGGLSGSPRPLPAGAPTAAEMEPGSEAMLQRAAAAKVRYGRRPPYATARVHVVTRACRTCACAPHPYMHAAHACASCMYARCTRMVKARLAARVLTPYEVAALICDDEEVRG